MEGLGELIANILLGVLEGITYAGARRAPPPGPMEPTTSEFMGMAFGVFIVIGGLMGLGVFLHQWSWEGIVRRDAPAQAVIVSIEKRQSGSSGYADVRLDYERQTPTGQVTCRRAPARFRQGAQDWEPGKMVEVYSQPGSCSQPFYAPDIGNPQTTLLVSLVAFPIGIAMLCSGYSSLRRRQRRLAMVASAARPTVVAP
jgi:hypothetical protein